MTNLPEPAPVKVAQVCDQLEGWAVEPPRDTHLVLSVAVPTTTFEEKSAVYAAVRAAIEGLGYRVDQIPSL